MGEERMGLHPSLFSEILNAPLFLYSYLLMCLFVYKLVLV